MYVRSYYFFFFNDTATTEIYTLSLHDALPIYHRVGHVLRRVLREGGAQLAERGEVGVGARAFVGVDHRRPLPPRDLHRDRKSTRLNSSHANISYAVFCLKKKKKYKPHYPDSLT